MTQSPPNSPQESDPSEDPSSQSPETDSAPQATAGDGSLDSQLTELEHRLNELSGEAETLEPTERNARLARLERDLCAVQCEYVREAGTREHPVLGVALGWEERLRRAGSGDAADEVEHVGAEILIHGLRERERGALDVLELPEGKLPETSDSGMTGAEGRNRLFHALLAVEELRQRVEGRATALGISNHADLRAVCEEAGRVQRVMRNAFKRTLEATPPDSTIRRAWVGRLVDLADETIIGAGERDPRIAARQLSETGRALEWHIDNVESRSGDQRRRLKRRVRRVEAERVEQHLEARLQKKFGKRKVELWDRAVLLGLAAVMVVLVLDLMHTRTPAWLLVVDTAICAFFLIDFFLKASLVGFHPTWLKRHVVTDFIPALPFGLILGLGAEAGAAAGATQETGRAARLLRLVRAVKIIRVFRAVSFLVRGLDRLVRQNARLLEGEVLVFPTPAERAMRRETTVSPDARLWRLRGSLDTLFEHLYDHAGEEERPRIEQLRVSALRDASRAVVPITDKGTEASLRRETLPLADSWLERLSVVRSEEVEGRVGGDAVLRIARGARLIAKSPLRILPLIRGWAPADAAELPDRRVASRTIRAVSRSLGRAHKRVLWWADLRGTMTPGELVGRVGSALVARTARPAVRLLMFGGLVLLLKLLLFLVGDGTAGGSELVGDDEWSFVAFLDGVRKSVEGLIVGAFVVIGSVCLALLAFGVWLQRLAQDATVFHERVARAQFLHLTDSIKARQRESDAELLGDRVFRLERNLFEAAGAKEASERDVARFVRHLHQFLAEGISPPSRGDGFDPVARAVMLHRDLLDGALLAESDTRATSQLLGNLALQRLVGQSRRISKAMRKRILKIDLERRRSFVRGPYLWFHAISRAMSSRSARLIVDYNGHAIPLSEISLALPHERARYEFWLAGGKGKAEEGLQEGGESDDLKLVTEAPEITTAFTVLHFMDDAASRDAEVEARFGERVLEKLRADRRALVRTVFGTYPLHRMPREQRVLNLRAVYGEWIEGGRVLLVPLRLMGIGFKLAFKGLVAVGRAVSAIRKPELFLAADREVEADFHAAARKIGRMRGPGAQAALYLRGVLDPEYHGLALPFGLHDAEENKDAVGSACELDANFLDADPGFQDTVAALAARAQRNIGRLERAAKDGLLERLSAILGKELHGDPTALRALVVLVHADDCGIRGRLFGLDVLCETTIDGLEFGLPKTGLFPPVPLWLSFRTWWSREGGEERVLEAVRSSGVLAVSGDEVDVMTKRELELRDKRTTKRVKRALWRALQADVDGARESLSAVRAAHGLPGGADEGKALAEESLAAALRHPARVTEQLVTLRAVQTLTLVDVRNYRRHVWSLGDYEKNGDPGAVWLDLNPRSADAADEPAEA